MTGDEYIWAILVVWFIVMFKAKPGGFVSWAVPKEWRRWVLMAWLLVVNGISVVILWKVYPTITRYLDSNLSRLIMIFIFIILAGTSIANCKPPPDRTRPSRNRRGRRNRPRRRTP